MLAEAAGISKIIIACGRTDLRKGIDGLAQLIGTKYDMNPFEKNVLFLFWDGDAQNDHKLVPGSELIPCEAVLPSNKRC